MRSDYADAAVSALVGSDGENKIYELSGAPIAHEEFAQVLGEVLRRKIPVRDVRDDGYAAALKRLGMADAVSYTHLDVYKRQAGSDGE